MAILSEKQHAHELLDLIPPLSPRPMEDEEIDEKEEQSVVRSKEWFRHNDGIPFEQMVAELGFTMDEIREHRPNNGGTRQLEAHFALRRGPGGCSPYSEHLAMDILTAIHRFAESGLGPVKKLHGQDGDKRLRVGDFRVRFTELNNDAIRIHSVKNRKDAYR